MPRCRRYHFFSASGSFDLKKIPPMPVTRAMSEHALHDEVAQADAIQHDVLGAHELEAAALEEAIGREARFGGKAPGAEAAGARLHVAQQPRGDSLGLVAVVNIERGDAATALQFAETDDLAGGFGHIGEVRPQTLVPAGLIHERRRPGLDLLRRVVAAVDVVHGVAEQAHDLQRVAGLEGADGQAGERHRRSNPISGTASVRESTECRAVPWRRRAPWSAWDARPPPTRPPHPRRRDGRPARPAKGSDARASACRHPESEAAPETVPPRASSAPAPAPARRRNPRYAPTTRWTWPRLPAFRR